MQGLNTHVHVIHVYHCRRISSVGCVTRLRRDGRWSADPDAQQPGSRDRMVLRVEQWVCK